MSVFPVPCFISKKEKWFNKNFHKFNFVLGQYLTCQYNNFSCKVFEQSVMFRWAWIKWTKFRNIKKMFDSYQFSRYQSKMIVIDYSIYDGLDCICLKTRVHPPTGTFSTSYIVMKVCSLFIYFAIDEVLFYILFYEVLSNGSIAIKRNCIFQL